MTVFIASVSDPDPHVEPGSLAFSLTLTAHMGRQQEPLLQHIFCTAAMHSCGHHGPRLKPIYRTGRKFCLMQLPRLKERPVCLSSWPCAFSAHTFLGHMA